MHSQRNDMLSSEAQTPAQSFHSLLLLADSALPLGSFAFSSGLESFLAHQTQTPMRDKIPALKFFLEHSLRSLASTNAPFVLAAHGDPARLVELDNDLDAGTLCNVARRASIAQGRGLMAVWERAFRESDDGLGEVGGVGDRPAAADRDWRGEAAEELRRFGAAVKRSAQNRHTKSGHACEDEAGHDDDDDGDEDDRIDLPGPSAHFAPLWGLVTLSLGISSRDALYMFFFSHLRTVVSAAVRASVLGPYQAQALLASAWARRCVDNHVRCVDADTTRAGQTVPAMDLWVGRHEMLYSRIFNS